MYSVNACVLFLLIIGSQLEYSLEQAAAFTCVPIGTCPAPPTVAPPSGIDLRIVTPNTGQCPAGQEPCTTLPVTQCGARYITNVSLANGLTSQGAWPWLAYIVNQTGYTGVGVLLDRYHVLTAAHKVNLNVATPGNIRVYLGVFNPRAMTNTINATAASIVIHPGFNTTNYFNDIAIIRLAQPVNIAAATGVNTACLPTQGQSFVGRNCTVSGWGQTAFGANDAPSGQQKQVTVPIVDYTTCRASMARADVLGVSTDRYLDPSGELCAGGGSQLDACTQDGGSPLVCLDPATNRYSIAGLVIWGKRCGTPGVYGVYVSVPNYRNWIDSTIVTLSG